jgi:hypothetical protein
VGAAYAYSYTTLKFDENGTTLPVDLKKLAFDVFLERRFGDRFTAQLGLGAALAGHVETLGTTYEVLPGPALSVAGSYRLVDGRGAAPFVMAGLSLAASALGTREIGSTDTETMYAFDGRLGLTVGKTIAGIVSPYVAARAFGLPVLWNVQGQNVTGTDKYHYQIGAGVAVRLGPADIVAEWVPLGEGEVLFGAGMAF